MPSGLLFSFLLIAPAQKDVIDPIVMRHKASRELLENIICNATFVFSPSQESTLKQYSWKCYYARSHERIRLIGEEGEERLDRLIEKTNSTTIRNLGGKTTSTKHQVRSPYSVRFDPMVKSLLAIYLPSAPYYTLEEFVAKAKTCSILDASSDFPKITTRHVIENSVIECEITLSKKHNYLIHNLKTVVTYEDESTVSESKVLRYYKSQNHIFIADRVVEKITQNNREIAECHFEMFNIQLRRPEDSAFRQQFKSGTVQANSTEGIYYKIDSQGRAVTPPFPLIRERPPAVVAEETDLKTDTLNQKPYSYQVYYIIAMIASIGIVTGFFWRKYKAFRSSS